MHRLPPKDILNTACPSWVVFIFGLLVLTESTSAQTTPSFTILENKPRSLDGKPYDKVSEDLVVPRLVNGEPKPGNRTVGKLEEYKKTKVFHTLYLPKDWQPQKIYPVIFEFAGNGPYRNKRGDVCTGKVEDGCLGYGMSGGEKFIWVCLPFISKDKQQNQLQWWGDVQASVEYCKRVVRIVCEKYGGDPDRILLCGFSRGSIACNFIGLHDDEIASIWCGMICHSHYDGVRRWNYEGDDHESAIRRLQRLKTIPQFICQELSTDATRNYLTKVQVQGDFTFLNLPFANHTHRWVLKELPEREQLRRWVQQVLVRARSNSIDRPQESDRNHSSRSLF